MSAVEIISTSPLVLPTGSAHQRRPRAAWRRRPEEFWKAYDSHTLFYDCFRAADGETVLLVGPPLRNLQRLIAAAEYQVDGCTESLSLSIHSSISISIVALSDVPVDAKTLGINIDGQVHSLTIQPNFADQLTGQRVMFTMNRNNHADWLTAWAQYHHQFHGVDAVVLFDNGSTNLSHAQIGAALEKSGVAKVFIVPWNHLYGPYDPKVIFNPYWTRFAQISAMSIALRRFAAAASGLLNCDIDELVHTRTAPDIFSELARTPNGLLVMHGRWIEAESSGSGFDDHRDFTLRRKDPKARHCAQRKWVLDPRQPWVADLQVHPYMHWIEHRPRGAKSMPPDCFYWHFKGINTNWKTDRNKPAGVALDQLEPDPEFAEVLTRWEEPSKSR